MSKFCTHGVDTDLFGCGRCFGDKMRVDNPELELEKNKIKIKILRDALQKIVDYSKNDHDPCAEVIIAREALEETEE